MQAGLLSDELAPSLNQATTLLRFNRFFLGQACYPDPAEGLWVLTQLARWDMANFPSHRQELLDRVYARKIFLEACEKVSIHDQEPTQRTYELSDGEIFSIDNPEQYCASLPFSAIRA